MNKQAWNIPIKGGATLYITYQTALSLYIYNNQTGKVYQEHYSILQLKQKSGMEDVEAIITHIKEHEPAINSGGNGMFVTWEPFLPCFVPYDKIATKAQNKMEKDSEKFRQTLFNQKIEETLEYLRRRILEMEWENLEQGKKLEELQLKDFILHSRIDGLEYSKIGPLEKRMLEVEKLGKDIFSAS